MLGAASTWRGLVPAKLICLELDEVTLTERVANLHPQRGVDAEDLPAEEGLSLSRDGLDLVAPARLEKDLELASLKMRRVCQVHAGDDMRWKILVLHKAGGAEVRPCLAADPRGGSGRQEIVRSVPDIDGRVGGVAREPLELDPALRIAHEPRVCGVGEHHPAVAALTALGTD